MYIPWRCLNERFLFERSRFSESYWEFDMYDVKWKMFCMLFLAPFYISVLWKEIRNHGVFGNSIFMCTMGEKFRTHSVLDLFPKKLLGIY